MGFADTQCVQTRTFQVDFASALVSWNTASVAADLEGGVVFTYAAEGGAKLEFEKREPVRLNFLCVGGEKFDQGADYLEYKKGNYYDAYSSCQLDEPDGDQILLHTTAIKNQDFSFEVTAGTGKWEGIKGSLELKLTFLKTRETPHHTPTNQFYGTYYLDGAGVITLPFVSQDKSNCNL